jgi:hypothetical protein
MIWKRKLKGEQLVWQASVPLSRLRRCAPSSSQTIKLASPSGVVEFEIEGPPRRIIFFEIGVNIVKKRKREGLIMVRTKIPDTERCECEMKKPMKPYQQVEMMFKAAEAGNNWKFVIQLLLTTNIGGVQCENQDVQRASDGNTLLHVAAASGNLEAVEEMLKFAPELDRRNRQGKTAYQVASSEAVRVLILGAERIWKAAEKDAEYSNAASTAVCWCGFCRSERDGRQRRGVIASLPKAAGKPPSQKTQKPKSVQPVAKKPVRQPIATMEELSQQFRARAITKKQAQKVWDSDSDKLTYRGENAFGAMISMMQSDADPYDSSDENRVMEASSMFFDLRGCGFLGPYRYYNQERWEASELKRLRGRGDVIEVYGK